MVGEIFAGLQGFNAALNGLKALRDIRDETIRAHAEIELVRQLVDMNGEMMAAQQREAALLERVRSLEAEIVQLKSRHGDLERYELKAIGRGASAYMLKPVERRSEPPHWLCPACYADGKKAILQRTVQTGTGHLFTCGGCGAKTIVGWSEPEWL